VKETSPYSLLFFLLFFTAKSTTSCGELYFFGVAAAIETPILGKVTRRE